MQHFPLRKVFDCDAIVVGAGPAGAAASYYLATRGFKVILVDKYRFPRDKVCGDFVGPKAQNELSKLGITNFPEYKKTNVVEKAAVFLDGEKIISRNVPRFQGLPQYGRVIPRIILDKWLLDSAVRAGAEVLEDIKAVDLEIKKDCVRLEVVSPSGKKDLQARLLIGADGSNSTIAHIVRGQTPLNADRIIAVRCYFEGIVGPLNQADLYFNSESFPGYCWLFPTGRNKANVGVGIVLDTIPPGNRLKDLLNSLIKNDASLRKRLRGAKMMGAIAGWPLTTYNPNQSIVFNKVMLVGDAAGLVNPLNGEGIQYALLSGRWAAEVASSCMKKNNFSKDALSEYSDIVEKELRYDMSLSSLIVQLIRNRSLNPLWLNSLRLIAARSQTDPDYADIVGGILMGSIPQSAATSLEILAGTLEQAVYSSGITNFYDSIQDPGYFVKSAIEIYQTSFEFALQATQNPSKFTNWILNSAVSASDLAIQTFLRSFETNEKNTKE